MSNLDELLERFRHKDRRALSRLLTLVSQSEQLDAIRAALATTDRKPRLVAVTGGGGVGKSSLVGRLLEHLRSRGKQVAVLACDPESPVTGGALLGDRIRMSGRAADPGLFIRSLATPGGQQSIAENVRLMAALLTEFGFDIVLLETVGAGQGDTAVRELADVLVVLLQPHSGDELQWEKAGLLEVADIVVINKADLPEADDVAAQVQQHLNLPGCRAVPVLKTSALKPQGVEALWRQIESLLTVPQQAQEQQAGQIDTWERIASLDDYRRVRESFRWFRPEYFNFGFDVLDRWAELQPDRPAIHWVGTGAESTATERVITYAQMRDRTDRVAKALADLGLQRGDRVVVVLPKIVEWWETLTGLLKAGLVALPGTVLLTSHDLAYRISAAEATAIITDAAGAAKIDEISPTLPKLKYKIVVGGMRPGWHAYDALVDAASRALKRVPTRASDPALIYFTSGTTGLPKMVLHTHASYGIGHRGTGRYWLDLTPQDLHWNLSDTGWAKAAWSSLFGPWNCGAAVFVQQSAGKFQPQSVIDDLVKYPITTLCAPPTAYRTLVQHDLTPLRQSKLRNCVAAGEPLNPEVIAVWERATGLTIRDGYGQTETVLLCANFPGVPVKPGAMGLPSPGFDLAIIDSSGHPLPPGEAGDIAIRIEPERPLGLFTEYWRDPDATRRSLRNGWYVTGDCGRTDADGYFWFEARGDDIISSSAYRIGPFEVESALIEHPAVVEAAVVGKPDPMRGEIVKAFVILAKGFEPCEALKVELQEHVKRTTAPYKYPREIEFLEDLPKTPSGKIRRVELRHRE